MVLRAYWEDRGHPSVSSDELAGEADVVVVGGGITGLTSALLLARAGRSVVLLEAHRLGFGTTGRSTAKLTLLQGARLAEVRSRHDDEVLRSYVAANRAAADLVARFADENGVGYERRADHAYAVGGNGHRTARDVLAAAEAADLDATWLDEAPLPFPTRGAVRLDGQLQLDPLELVAALGREARSHGVRIVEGARVRHVRGRDPVEVGLADGRSVRAPHVIIAIGLPMTDRAGFFARMTPARSYSLAFRSPGDRSPVDGMFLSLDGSTRSLRDADDGRVLLVGGAGHTTGRTASPYRHLEELRTWTSEYFPGVEETHAWSAQDFVPHHGLPYAGPLLPGSDQLLFAGGFAKWGMTNGVAAAQVLAARVLGDRPSWATAFETWSTHELRGLARDVVANGEVGFEMARGWAGLALRTAATRRTPPVCTHLGGVVRWNDAERSWDCPLHGSRFGPDGEVLEGPATCGLRRMEQTDEDSDRR